MLIFPGLVQAHHGRRLARVELTRANDGGCLGDGVRTQAERL